MLRGKQVTWLSTVNSKHSWMKNHTNYWLGYSFRSLNWAAVVAFVGSAYAHSFLAFSREFTITESTLLQILIKFLEY
jgi:hypothetical protein